MAAHQGQGMCLSPETHCHCFTCDTVVLAARYNTTKEHNVPTCMTLPTSAGGSACRTS